MTKVKQIERAVENLTRDELEAFRDWFLNYEATIWDTQMEADIKAGKLDKVALEAIAAHNSGRSREL